MRIHKAFLLASAATGLTMAQAGQAQETSRPTSAAAPAGADRVAAAPPAAAQPEEGVQDILVTAERVERRLQRLPTTASVLTGTDLNAQQVQTVDGLTRTTPSFTVNDTGASKAINVRGVGKSLTAPGVQAGVGFYVDGVPIPNDLFLNTPFFDLSRVELLRGPQGTLVGMNSTGGALLIVTQNPIYGVWSGSLEQAVGNYGELRTRGSLNLPIGDSFGLHLAGEYEKRDSFFDNVSPVAGDPGDFRRTAVRGTLGGRVTDGLEIFLRGEYIRSVSDGVATKPIPGDPAPAYARYLAASPADPFTLSRSTDTANNLRYFRLSAEIRLDIGDFAQLRSVTGFQRGKLLVVADGDGSAAPSEIDVTRVNEPVLSQEFNLIGNPGGALDWVLGYFYLAQNTTGTINNRIDPVNIPILNIIGRSRLRNRGVFGQATYHVSDKLDVTGGIRFNRERHYFGPGAQVEIPPIRRIIPLNGESTDHAVTGRFTVDYKLTPEQFLYATVSRGFKGGGLNTDGIPFAPEKIWNYEAGLKSSFLGNHIRTQLGVYVYRNQDIQLQVYSPITTQNDVTNITDGRTAGVEGQAQGQFGDLALNVTAAYNHTRFDRTALFDPRYPSATPVQVGGRQFLFAPEFTFNAGIEYAFPLGDRFKLTPRAQYSHTSSQWAAVFQVRPTDFIGARDLVDLSLRLTPDGKGWSAEAYVTNLTDKTYVLSKTVATAAVGRVQLYGPPRQYGVRLGFSF